MLDSINSISELRDLDFDKLNILASDIRKFLVENISLTGGHLASNLGVVDVTLALFKVFDFDNDKIVFDVGHQCYTYKILTGRKDKMSKLRKYKGISGFPKTIESKYDFFNTGHASNSISAALGMARARDLKNEKHNVIAFIGDGSLTGGMTFEALNDIGYRKSKLLIILNDNGMAISSNVGSLSNCLNQIRINPFYNSIKKKTHYQLDKIKSRKMIKFVKNIKNSVKGLILPSMYFENLGIKYIGPIDGHDIKKMCKVFSKIKKFDEPVVVHIRTKKGKGYEYAEKNPNKYHGVNPFSIIDGTSNQKKEVSYSSKFGEKLVSLAANDNRIVAITAAMKDGTGLTKFADLYKERFFDVGICEEHAVSLAAGLAISGFKPFFAVYSSFLQRGFDQIIEDVCMQKLPVVFVVDRSGIVGEDGETHHGIFDNSYLSLIPGLTIIQPKCVEDLVPILDFVKDFNYPIVLKYPKGKNQYHFKSIKKIEYGKWEVVSDGERIALIATGRMVEVAMKVKKKLKENIMVINAMFIKPLDEEMLNYLTKNKYKIFVIEENVVIGGLGSNINLKINNKINIIGIDDKYVEQGRIDQLLENEGFCVDRIEKLIREKCKI